MKKLLLSVVLLASLSSLFAGGLVTNTNQSALFTRFLCRDATLGIDAVYFNPAGLATFEDGLYLSFNNQFINQTQSIGNNYSFLTNAPNSEYTGIVKAPLFPSFYGAYKIGHFALSVGFNPIGGGGGAVFDDGLPSFETMVADLVPLLSSQIAVLDQGIIAATGGTDPGFRNITGYTSDIFFEGSSIYFGYQANASYNVSDKLSVAIGARLVTAKNTYNGYIDNVTIDAPTQFGGTQTPGNYLRFLAATPFVGVDSPTGQGMVAMASSLDDQTKVEADVIRKGSGVTPIFSVNFAPNDMINLAVKYEFKTKLELATTVNDGKDAGGLFTDGEAIVADMPAQLVVGAAIKPNDKILISTGLHYFFDKDNDYDGSIDSEVVMIDKNYLSYALGIEYGITEKLRVSAGYAGSKTGVNDLFQSDQRFSLNTNSFAGGFGISLLPNLDLDLGGTFVMYEDGQRGYPHSLGEQSISVTETYDKSVWIVAVGLNFSILD